MQQRHRELEIRLTSTFGEYRTSNGSSGLEYQVCCPYCITKVGKQDTTFKLSMNPGKGVWHCWRCESSGHISSLVKGYKGRGITGPPRRRRTIDPTFPGELLPISTLPLDHLGNKYLRSRNYDPREMGEIYNIQFCPQGGTVGKVFNTSNTLVFPITMDDKQVGWQARLLYNPEKLVPDEYPMYGFTQTSGGKWILPPKYMTSPGLHKAGILYNYDIARMFRMVVVCEGVFDVMRVGPNAVSIFGKYLSEQQKRLLQDKWDLVIMLLDPEDAQKEMVQAEQAMSISVPCVSVVLKGYADPGDTPREEIWKQIFKVLKERNIEYEKYLE